MSTLSHRAGLSESLGAGAIAAILPALIDKLTSDGRPPAPTELSQRSGSILDSIGARAPSPAGPTQLRRRQPVEAHLRGQPDQIKNPDLIQPGWKLKIPKP